MAKKIRTTGPTAKVTRDTSVPLPRVEPATVAAALTAEPRDPNAKKALAPTTLLAIRSGLVATTWRRGPLDA